MRKKIIVGAVGGCVLALPVLFVLVLVGAFFEDSKFVELWISHIVSVFAIVGAVIGGTEAILERIDRP